MESTFRKCKVCVAFGILTILSLIQWTSVLYAPAGLSTKYHDQ